MASANTSNGQPRAAHHTVSGNSVVRVTGTGWIKTTIAAQVGANSQLVKSDQSEEEFAHFFLIRLKSFVNCSESELLAWAVAADLAITTTSSGA